MTHQSNLKEEQGHGTYRSYIIGFILSILLTLTAYLLVEEQIVSGSKLIALISGLGLLQVVVQLLFFLHLGAESKPFWNLQVFLFTALVLVIIVWGSLWIMEKLNYRVMPMEMKGE